MDRVIPVSVEASSFDVDGGHFLIRDYDGVRIAPGVELTVDGETGSSGGGRYQVDDDTVAYQWLGAPVLRDEREQAMLNLVPFAGAGRKVTDGDRDADLVGEALQLALPQPNTRAVAAAAIGRNEQSLGRGIANATNILPPS